MPADRGSAEKGAGQVEPLTRDLGREVGQADLAMSDLGSIRAVPTSPEMRRENTVAPGAHRLHGPPTVTALVLDEDLDRMRDGHPSPGVAALAIDRRDERELGCLQRQF